MKYWRSRLVRGFARLIGVPVEVRQDFFMKGTNVAKTPGYSSRPM